MKITFVDNPQPGVPLSTVPFGTVVSRCSNAGDTAYMVCSPMDGTGRRVLLTLSAGVLKNVDQDTRVLPRDAYLVVGAFVDVVDTSREPPKYTWRDYK